MRILFVEDQRETIEPAMDAIKDLLEEPDLRVCGFEDAENTLKIFRPHLVILDLIRDGSTPEPEYEGLNTYRSIWERHFCPVVVYSARKDEFDVKVEHHPLVRSVSKGSGSEEVVASVVTDLKPHLEALRNTEEQIEECLSLAMRETALRASATPSEIEQMVEIVTRSGRRRVAAMMDEPMAGQSRLASWEIYLYPPVTEDIQLGDILKRSDGDNVEPSSFRIVLTPSCDMVDSSSQQPKVETVLAAKCCSMREGLDLTSFKGITSPSRLKDRLPSTILNPGYYHPIIPLPALGKDIPVMAANLRDLELIPMGGITDESLFSRIASVDSPFREMVAWAYMQTAGRPGLPDRDTSSWADEIVSAMQESGGV